jgi:hypothetical protein
MHDVLLVGADQRLMPFEGLDIRGITALGLAQVPAARRDSADYDPQVSVQEVFHRISGNTIAEHAKAMRLDSWSASMGNAQALDLTAISNEVLTQPLPELQALANFYTDSTLAPAGSAFYAMRRKFIAGKAEIHGGGSNVPMASSGETVSGQRPTRYLVAGASVSLFQRMTNGFSGRDTFRDAIDGANRAIAEKHDELTWSGSSTYDVWGVLNYPYSSVAVSATPISSASSSATIIAAVTAMAFYAKVNSKSVYVPDSCVMSEKLSYYLSSTYVSSDNASNVTLLELIKKACPHIKKWWTAWRLDEAGPSSSHGMLFYRDGREGIRVVTPIETVMAPIQTVGFNDNVYLYKQIGGVFEPNAAHQLLVWFAM